MAERLGTGLQNLLHRFESGSDLTKKRPSSRKAFFVSKQQDINLFFQDNLRQFYHGLEGNI